MVKYVSGSTGEEFNLSGNASRVRLKEAGFYDYSWEPDVVTRRSGNQVTTFRKKEKEYKLGIDFFGGRSDRAETLRRFFELTEKDILANEPGRLYLNDQYIECFITEGDVSDQAEQYTYVQKEVTVFAPNPFWTVEKDFSYLRKWSETSSVYLEYKYDFDYDYSQTQKGIDYLNNDHFSACDFRMRIYGPVVNPSIIINGHLYAVYTTIEQKEYLTISSRDNTVIRTKVDGTLVDEYNNREKEQRIFEKIPSGNLTVSWSGNFGFDVTVLQERSEPEWN
ncbi:hypothetical protein LQE92_11905 [Lacrimispora sp. NSJ-141]|uniref:Phage tail protein n=1 Tax=Lientehia hominis TaxID=2897778 RepID=A0AAP2W8B6_9FIRM|nr:hypothetical protein [Lientehia hominis]MCD2493318.1 hypothetical protein [Lientehia hominis]